MKPCKTCPFRRDVDPGALGGSSAETFIGQAHGPFWLPCHSHTNFSDPNWKTDYSQPQCAGAAIYRANAVKYPLPKQLLKLPPDTATVFQCASEFLGHHWQIDGVEAAKRMVKAGGVESYVRSELTRAGVVICDLHKDYTKQ